MVRQAAGRSQGPRSRARRARIRGGRGVGVVRERLGRRPGDCGRRALPMRNPRTEAR